MGTAAWKLRPVAGEVPETWNLAKIMTIPGFAADVCGVRVIFNSFLSYAVYDVRREAAGGVGCATATGGDWDCGKEKAEDTEAVGDDMYEGGVGVGVDDVVVDGPKRLSISSTADRWDEAGEVVEPLLVAPDEPKISARRSWFD